MQLVILALSFKWRELLKFVLFKKYHIGFFFCMNGNPSEKIIPV